jgi:hypothetical protein
LLSRKGISLKGIFPSRRVYSRRVHPLPKAIFPPRRVYSWRVYILPEGIQTATAKKAQDDFFVAPIVDVTAFALSRCKRFRTWTTSFWVFFLTTSVHSLTSVRISSNYGRCEYPNVREEGRWQGGGGGGGTARDGSARLGSGGKCRRDQP